MIKTIPIFYSCDNNFARFTQVSVVSMLEHSDKKRHYTVYILNTGIDADIRAEFDSLQTAWFRISFIDVSKYFDCMSCKLPLRDYYSKTTYYRLLIADIFPEYDKAIYIDSDTVVLGDVAALYDTDIGDNYVGAAHEQVMVQTPVYGNYTESVLGIDRGQYFNAGVLLINCSQFRKKHLLKRFSDLLKTYTFAVTQDQDYLNVICKDHVYWLHQKWNCEIFGDLVCSKEEARVVHYIMTSKPWHYSDCRWSDLFWKYAEKSPSCGAIRAELAGFTDEKKASDELSGKRLAELARTEIKREDSYFKCLRNSQACDRVAILQRIEELETAGDFYTDVEEDPPAPMLKAEEIDYLDDSLSKKVKTFAAFVTARAYLWSLLKSRRLIVKDIVGLENFSNLESGAIITCNHFNAYDSFAMNVAYYASGHKKRKFYRVIREGNYTGFPGYYGFLMRNCDTIPLSSSTSTMRKLVKAVDTRLQDGNFVLFYPEQSMWWNYRKPKPLKTGAFSFAVKNNVPVLPCFITMRDSDKIGADGFPVQEYTIHVGEPILPDESLDPRARMRAMCDENYEVWKNVYEETYGIPLIYSTVDQVCLERKAQ